MGRGRGSARSGPGHDAVRHHHDRAWDRRAVGVGSGSRARHGADAGPAHPPHVQGGNGSVQDRRGLEGRAGPPGADAERDGRGRRHHLQGRCGRLLEVRALWPGPGPPPGRLAEHPGPRQAGPPRQCPGGRRPGKRRRARGGLRDGAPVGRGLGPGGAVCSRVGAAYSRRLAPLGHSPAASGAREPARRLRAVEASRLGSCRASAGRPASHEAGSTAGLDLAQLRTRARDRKRSPREAWHGAPT
mmetsp:Transcript_61664/g.183729  ORF Transcript_61664/g.183729 Transcript_61664/m.183729 type:complete len:244 (+) Transcript_61664:231-962(+)